MSPSVWVKGFPLPPSINAQLASVGGRSRKTAEARTYDNQIAFLRARREDAFREARLMFEPFLQDHTIRVDIYVVFHKPRVFTKSKGAESWVKQIDHLNYDKSSKDALAKCLNIDDKYFFAGEAEKIFCEHKYEEQVIFRLSLHKPRSLSQIYGLMDMDKEPQDGVSNH